MMKTSRLVYSTDPKRNQKCVRCKEVVSECTCRPEVEGISYPISAILRMERAGRGGKTVTVIDQLPLSETFLKELCGELKKKCGSGGTYFLNEKYGVVEIQGDKREAIRLLLLKKGISVKG